MKKKKIRDFYVRTLKMMWNVQKSGLKKSPDGCVFSFFIKHFSERLENFEQVFKAFKISNIWTLQSILAKFKTKGPR